MQVSLVIPCFNRKELLAFGLESLKTQTTQDFEVVLVDDASTDGLGSMVKSNCYPFNCRLIQHSKNKGRSAARNTGITEAKGEIIVLADADSLFPKNYIANHLKQHNREKLVVSGAADFYPIYTYYFSELNSYHKNNILKIIKNNTDVRSSAMQYNKKNNDYPVALLQDIKEGQLDKYCIRYWKGLFPDIRKEYGEYLKKFNPKWLAFIGSNVSVKREDLISIGLFDERFREYGLEDWELGYRFYKEGYDFIVPADVYNYHQEHPRNYKKVHQGNVINYKLFLEKHPDLEIYLLSFLLTDWQKWHVNNLGKLYKEVEIILTNNIGNNSNICKYIQIFFQLFASIYIQSGNLLSSREIKEKAIKLYKKKMKDRKLEETKKFIKQLEKKETIKFPFLKKALD